MDNKYLLQPEAKRPLKCTGMLTQTINFNHEKITYFEPNIKITKCRFPHKNKDAYSRTVPMLRPLQLTTSLTVISIFSLDKIGIPRASEATNGMQMRIKKTLRSLDLQIKSNFHSFLSNDSHTLEDLHRNLGDPSVQHLEYKHILDPASCRQNPVVCLKICQHTK